MTSRPTSLATGPADREMLEEIANAVRAALACEVVSIALADGPGSCAVRSVVGSGQVPAPGATVEEDAWPAATLLKGTDGGVLGVLGAGWGDAPVPDGAARTLEGIAVPVARWLEQVGRSALAEASRAELLDRAMTDPLTGVGNRTLLLERLRHATTARAESAAMMGLVFIDLDHFKAVNDDHTHEVGDLALQEVAQRIQGAVRAHDTVARWGGDEFLVLLNPVLDEHAALGVVQRILRAVTGAAADSGAGIALTASIGVAFWNPGTDVEPEELIRRADAAMYDAKERGRDQFAIFDALDPAAARRLHLRELLDRADDDDRMAVHYQPIVAVEDGRIAGVEALLRLRDDDGTLVYPAELLHGGTVPSSVARSAMRTACRDMAAWLAEGHDLWLSVNVSAQQVADADGFAADVEEALADAALAPDRLTLELTEHTLLNTTPRALEELQRLVDRGVSVSIDDFGTGYGSMTYVRVMPVHELKVDRSFVQEQQARAAATAVVRAVASLARELGLRCVAEGVEDAGQHELLRSMGVPLAQGRHYAEPLDPEGLADLLRTRTTLLRPGLSAWPPSCC